MAAVRAFMDFICRRPVEDGQITYLGGETVRRVQRRRRGRVEWFVNGAPTCEAEAKAFQRETEERLEAARLVRP